jgi:hypothetical protein
VRFNLSEEEIGQTAAVAAAAANVIQSCNLQRVFFGTASLSFSFS